MALLAVFSKNTTPSADSVTSKRGAKRWRSDEDRWIKFPTYDWQASDTLILGLSRSSRSRAFNSVNRLSFSSAIDCFFSRTAPAEWSAILPRELLGPSVVKDFLVDYS